MAREWYVRGDDGADSNSGDSDQAAAELSLTDLVVSGTNVSTVTGGLTGFDQRAINLQNVGGSHVCIITVATDTTGTISAAPPDGDGTYNAKIGGARAAITQVARSNVATANPAVVTADRVNVRPKTGGYNEAVFVTTQSPSVVSLGGEVTVDGTGLGAGTDNFNVGNNVLLNGFRMVSAVDRCVSLLSAGAQVVNCVGVSPGSIGIAYGSNRASFCAVSGATIGISGSGTAEGCQASGCSVAGFGPGYLYDNLAYENAIGFSVSNSIFNFIGNSALYSTGDGVNIDNLAWVAAKSQFQNNLIAFNGGWGIDSVGQNNFYQTRNNHYHSNTSGDRNNFNADEEGYEGPTGDPLFVNVASDDYRLKTGSPDHGTGLGPTGLYLNVGATPFRADYPIEDNVRDGVNYADSTLTGNVVLPAENEVEDGVGYGSNGTEFEGSLAVQGGGRGFFPTNAAQRRR